jgi:hypothetical protein
MNTKQLFITSSKMTQTRAAIWSNFLYPADITQKINYDTILIIKRECSA